MNLFTRLRNAFASKGNPAYAGWATDTSWQQVAQPRRNYATFLAEGFRQNGPAYTCISLVSRALGGINWKLYTDDSMQREITTGPLLDLWKHPNPEMSNTSFVEAWCSYMLLTGNGYIQSVQADITKAMGQKGPDQLWVRRPDKIRIVPSGDGMKNYQDITIAGAPTTIDGLTMLHTKFFAGDDDFYGLAPLEVAAIHIDKQVAGHKWNLAQLSNGANPKGAWYTDAILNKNDRESLKRRLKEEYYGPRNAGTAPILDAGLKFQQTSMSPADMDWASMLESDTRLICAIFHVAPELAGDAAGKTFANYAEARESLYEETVLPIGDILRDGVNAWLIPLFYPQGGAYLTYDVADIEALQGKIQKSKQSQAEQGRTLWTVGLATLNEARELQGLAPIPGGDILQLKTAFVPMDMLEDYAEQAMVAKMAGLALAASNPLPPNASTNNMPAQQNGGQTPPGTPVPPAPLAQPTPEKAPPEKAPETEKRHARYASKALDLSTTESKATYFAQMEASRAHWIEDATKRLQDYFTDEHTRLMAAINQTPLPETAHYRVESVLNQLAPQFKQMFVTLYQDVTGAVGSEIAKAFATAKPKAKARKDYAVDAFNQTTVDYLDSLAGSKVQQIDDTTLALLQSALAEGVALGESIPQLSKRVDALYLQQIIPNRSATIARTEVCAATNYGAMDAARQSGLTLTKVWLSAHDAHTRPDHGNADGQEVPMEEPFKVGGYDMMQPGDGPASETANCRCTVYFKRAAPVADPVAVADQSFVDALAGMSTLEKAAYLEEHGGQAWRESLSKKEYAAIQKYTAKDYTAMNGALRNGTYNPAGKSSVDKLILNAQSGLLKSSAPCDLVVMRGYGNSQFEKFLAAAQSGQPFRELGFASTTIDSSSGFGNGFRVNIHVSQGAPGAYVGNEISAFSFEREFLIPPGAEFKVLSAPQQDKNGRWIFEVAYTGVSSTAGKHLTIRLQWKADPEKPPKKDDEEENGPWPDDKYVSEEGDIVWLDADGNPEEDKQPADTTKNKSKRALYRAFMEATLP